MNNSDDFNPMPKSFIDQFVEFTREQLIASAPPEHRSQLMHKHINESFDEKYMNNPIVRTVVNAGIHNNLSEVDMLKHLVVVLADEREELLNEKIKQSMELTSKPLFFTK